MRKPDMVGGIYRLPTSADRIREARPDVLKHVGQLTAGQVVIRFERYVDIPGHVNRHAGSVAVIFGPAYRIIDGEIVDRGIGLGAAVRVERLPAYTFDGEVPATKDGAEAELREKTETAWLRIGNLAIHGMDEDPDPPYGVGGGLLIVRQNVVPEVTDLEVGPGLYIDGANDYHSLWTSHHMHVVLDSDPALQGFGTGPELSPQVVTV